MLDFKSLDNACSWEELNIKFTVNKNFEHFHD